MLRLCLQKLKRLAIIFHVVYNKNTRFNITNTAPKHVILFKKTLTSEREINPKTKSQVRKTRHIAYPDNVQIVDPSSKINIIPYTT